MPAILPPTVQNHSEYILYVGTYSPGIQAYRFHLPEGRLEALGQVGEVQNPSFLTVDSGNQHLYAVSELDGNTDGGVAAFRIDKTSGQLQKLNQLSSAGVAPCHLALDPSGKMLLVANYGTGAVSVFPIESNGSLGEMSTVLKAEGSGPNKDRQKGPHAHEVVFAQDGQHAFVPDLGLDQIRVIHVDAGAGKAEAQSSVKLAPGTGPRHMALSRNGQYAYVFGELKSTITVLKRTGTNEFEAIQTIDSLPKQEDGGAEILIDRSGRFVYASNRDLTGAPGSISVFSVDAASGKLTFVDRTVTAGPMPRGVDFDPTGAFLLVGDQKKDLIQIFAIDNGSGKLTATGKTYEVKSPVAFTFVPVS